MKKIYFSAIITASLLLWICCRPAIAEMRRTPLHTAIKLGDNEGAKHLVVDGANVNSVDVDGRTPLHYAAENCNIDLVEFLLDNEAEIDRQDAKGNPPIFDAILHHCMETTKLFIDRGNDVNKKYGNGWTALRQSINWNTLDIAEMLIENGADVNEKDSEYGFTLLHSSSIPGWIEFATLFLDHGADINAKTKDGRTPLYEAAWSAALSIDDKKNDTTVKYFIEHGAKVDTFTAAMIGDADVIKQYLDHGGDPNADLGFTGTLLGHAAMGGNVQIIDMLIDHGAKVNYNPNESNTPLIQAVVTRNKDAVLELLKRGADVSLPSGDRTPLFVAASLYHPNQKIIDALISHGAKMDIFEAVCLNRSDYVEDNAKRGGDMNAVGPQDYTPLYAATWCKQKDMVKLLLEKGADPNVPIRSKDFSDPEHEYFTYPLHRAAVDFQDEIATLLLEYGANANALDERKETPLHVAAGFASAKVAEILIAHGADVNAQNDQGKTPLDRSTCSTFQSILERHGGME